MATSESRQLKHAEAVLKALANRRRLLILAVLREREERTVGSLAEETRLAVKTVSRNLRLLEQSGLLLSRRQGIYICYRLSDSMPRFVRQTIDELAAVAR